MSRRKGSNLKRRDNDFDRNSSRLLSTREDTRNTERQLFNPRTDHPIRFNKSTKDEPESISSNEPSPRPTPTLASSARGAQTEPLSFVRRPTGRRLWTASDMSPSQSSRSKNDERLKVMKASQVSTAEPAPANTEDPHRKKLKSLIASLRTIEAKLDALTTSSRALPCFEENDIGRSPLQDDRRQRNSSADKPISQEHGLLTEQDIADAEKIWREKMSLHLTLSGKYLEILKHDLEYAEKKGLESLCWKRAIYSLVDQFRRALKRIGDHVAAAAAAAAATATMKDDHAPKESVSTHSELAAMLFEDDDDLAVAAATTTTAPAVVTGMMGNDNSMTEMPVIHEGGGMTFIKVENPKRQENNHQLRSAQLRMTLTLFLEYLDLADHFYLELTLFLKKQDDADDSDLEKNLVQWRRIKRYKWYSCIPSRGDLARYRWSYVPEDNNTTTISASLEDELNTPLSNSPEQQEQQREQSAITQWTKSVAFEEAWRRYFLGIWLMPAKGNLYFNLSLLLQRPHTCQQLQGYEFHKLYFSTRSLMVRRNGFLNARESMLVLFEGNRRWVKKYVEFDKYNSSSKSKNKRSVLGNSKSKPRLTKDKNLIVPALFIRLHGLLFTKIGLDEFPRMKRLFFNTLFEDPQAQLMQKRFEEFQFMEEEPKPTNDFKQLSREHMFWFETVILCLSSLYSYDFAGSKMAKLIAANSNRLFYATKDEKDGYQTLLEDMKENILFGYGIDLTCQIAVELLQRFVDSRLSCPPAPILPHLPNVSLKFADNKDFLFGSGHNVKEDKNSIDEVDKTDELSWLVYIEILLHWIVLNGICIRTQDKPSLWELFVSDIGYDLVTYQRTRLPSTDSSSSKISSAFWPLLLIFLNKLLSELPDEIKYDMINKHWMEDEEDENNEKPSKSDEEFSDLEYTFSKNVMFIMGLQPDLPEEDLLRGLGWVDEIHGRFLRLELAVKEDSKLPTHYLDTVTRRKIKILEYGFTLVKHLNDILYYDPVEEMFTVSKSAEERVSSWKPEDSELELAQTTENLEEHEESTMTVSSTITEMEDDVLLSSETGLDDDASEGDDIVTQLKKRREQLQSIVASAEAEERFGYRRLPARAMEREARLNYLRERIIPGKTILVLDTNCFIGHLDHVKRLLQSQKWSIIVPLVVVTELDGLKTNTQRLGLVAQEGIKLIETTLANKPKQSTFLRIQTSHNNFMNDISIRSEQFVFGESDKNLDDLILSTCLWWIAQQSSLEDDDSTVPVCLITGDRNLSVKARARDVEVVPVSAIIQLTP